MNHIHLKFLTVILLLSANFLTASAQTNILTYQGRLNDAAAVSENNSYLMKFELYADAAGNTLIDTLNDVPVSVSNKIFTIQLNFAAAAAFDGSERYLRISVRHHANEIYTPLDPLQRITSAPYAIRTKNAASADVSNNALNIGGTPAANIIKEGDARLTDARLPISGSGDYIQNRTTAQTATNFNISGSGTADVFDAATGFRIGGLSVFSVPGIGNNFVGHGAGESNTTGVLNSFFGVSAGNINTTGSRNSVFGATAGTSNTTGAGNSFFGSDNGTDNSEGSNNSFFGREAGLGNTAGDNNTFVGLRAGAANLAGGNNSALGSNADFGTGELMYATAIGSNAVVGTDDTITIGKVAGTYNGEPRPADAVQIPGTLTVTGLINGTVTNATNAINAANAESATNAANLGGIEADRFVKTDDQRLSDSRTPTPGSANYIQNSTVQQSGNFNVAGSGTIGATLTAGKISVNGGVYARGGEPGASGGNNNGYAFSGNGGDSDSGLFSTTNGQVSLYTNSAERVRVTDGGAQLFGSFSANTINGTQYNIGGNQVLSIAGTENLFAGTYSGIDNSSGKKNSFFGFNAGRLNTAGSNNSFVGNAAGVNNSSGSSNVFFGDGAGRNNTTGNSNSFIGVGAGDANSTGGNNTALGLSANVGSSNLSFATAIGSGAVVTTSNTIVLGRTSDTVQVSGSIRARGGAPGISNINNNGYGFSGSGDSDSGMFSSGDGQVSLYSNSFETVRVTPGSVEILGSLSKSSGSFKIDHPLDPQNKYLYHSFVESPDMMNIYNGNATLDQNGETIVTLPAWFEALNREFRYQLTPLGGSAPNLYIAEEVSGNAFKIAGGKSGLRVSWQVTGIRRDKYAEDNRIQPEVEKPAGERGQCLYAPACQNKLGKDQ